MTPLPTRERAMICGTSGPSEWTLRCLHRYCVWRAVGFQTLEAAVARAEVHARMTGHPVRPEGTITVLGEVVRAKGAGR